MMEASEANNFLVADWTYTCRYLVSSPVFRGIPPGELAQAGFFYCIVEHIIGNRGLNQQ